MASVFDGMAGVLTSVFGASVLFVPQVGTSRAIQSVFRETPITIVGEDGRDLLIFAPTWRVQKDLLSNAVRGDQIEVTGGRRFGIKNQIGSGSPADDAFVIYELEDLT